MRSTKTEFKADQYQRGLSTWGWLFAVILGAFVVISILNIGPHYVDFRVVQGITDKLPEKTLHQEMSKNQIYEHFKKQFRIENFPLKPRDMMTIERSTDETVLNIDYEIREPLVFNIDVVLKFSEQRTFE